MNRSAPHVNVLLLNWNGWQETIDCLESVFRLDYPNFSVVVCDNCSTDGSQQRIRDWARSGVPGASRPPDQLHALVSPPTDKPISFREYSRAEAEAGGGLETPGARLTLIDTGQNLGFAGGNNVGLRYLLARGTDGLVWVLNNDILVAVDALSKLVECLLEGERVGGVSAKLFHLSDPGRVQIAGGGRFLPWTGMATVVRADPAGATPPDYLTAGCMLVALDVVRRAGTLDERYFMYVEDVDYSLRIRRLGLALVYCPAAHVWHKGNVSVPARSERHDYYTVRNALMLTRRFYPACLPSVFVYTVLRCLLPKVVRFEFGRARAVLRGYRDFAQGVAGPMPELPATQRS